LKEFCDQLPEAVILTDKQGEILTWNSAAERLYGRSWQQLRRANVTELYEDPRAYNAFLQEVQSQYPAGEKIFSIRHPEKGSRFISTSMTVLYDGHHNFQGILSLGRDVTRQKNLEKKYKRVGYWLICAFVLLGLAATAAFFSYFYLSRNPPTKNLRHQLLQDNLAKDYFVLKSLLSEQPAKAGRLNMNPAIKNFFRIQKTALPYTGLILLDDERTVIDAYSIAPHTDLSGMIGSSYAAIKFEGRDSSLPRVLTLYRPDKEHPMGKKSVEIAFELHQDGRLTGWLIFQMDMERLKNTYGIDLADLKALRFEKP
jgi:PAS domain S-box-containing protein